MKKKLFAALLAAFFIFLTFIFFLPPSSAASVASTAVSMPGAASKSRTDITSDSLRVDNKKHIAVFTGHVVAVKGKLKIFSSKLNVIYTKKNKIKMLVANGNVHNIKEKDNITGGKAVYYERKGIAVITENPVAYEGKNKIAGTIITINFKTGISTVFGGKKRVNAVVYANKSLTVKK